MKISTYLKLAAAITVIVLLLAGFFWLRDLTKDDHFSFGSDPEIDVTPTQIMSIKAIGEWEFLSVNAEELVDTVRKGFFSDDELARIYYGTLRLGIDMSQLEPGWIEAKGDSVMLLLHRRGPHQVVLRERQMEARGQGGTLPKSLPSDEGPLSHEGESAGSRGQR